MLIFATIVVVLVAAARFGLGSNTTESGHSLDW